ncbi:MAG: molybdenum cofactor guanylyltransferase [Dehalococcoidales bacterium]
MEVTGIILAGGKSLRFGRNKAVEVIAGKTLLERVVKHLSVITHEIILVTNEDSKLFGEFNFIDVVSDIYPAKGPLGGIYTGLSSSHSSANIVVACDMPFLNTELLEHMVKNFPGFDAVIPRWPNNQIEPLHGVYSIDCVPVMKKHLENNQLSISDCLKEMHVLYFEKEEFSKFDPEFLSFFNINSQADIELFKQIEAGKQIE